MEFAVVLPLVLVLALGLLQVALVVRDQLAVGLAAREGARSAVVAADPGAAARAAVSRTLPGVPADVHVSTTDGTVTVVVSVAATASTPLWGSIVGGRELSAAATMALEPPDHPVP